MDLETCERRDRRIVYGCLIGFGTFLHLLVALLTLGARTSCAWPPCHTSMWFHAWAWFWRAPVFVTPWVRLPIEEMGFAWTPVSVGLVVLNSWLAVCLMIVAVRAGRAGSRMALSRWREHRARRSRQDVDIVES